MVPNKWMLVLIVAGVVLVAAELGAVDKVVDEVLPPSWKVSGDGASYRATSGDAVGASGNDAAEVIQDCIDSLDDDPLVRETVLLEGTFVLDEPIVLTSDMTLRLDGKVMLADNANCHLLTGSGLSNVVVVGGEWDGRQDFQSLGGCDRRGFSISSSQDVTFRDLSIHSISYDNIECSNCDRVTISNVHAYDCGDYGRGAGWLGHGFGMYYCDDCVIEGCHIEDCASGGVYFYCEDDGRAQTVNGNIMRNNVVERTKTSGLSISLRGHEDQGRDNRIEGNTLIDCGGDNSHPYINLGFDGVNQASYCTVANNELYSSSAPVGYGIRVTGNHCTISNNRVHDVRNNGIEILAGEQNTISGNIVERVTNGGYCGVLVHGSRNTVSGNTISDISHSCVRISGSENAVQGNTLRNAGSYWIYIDSSSSQGNVLGGNVMEGTGSVRDLGTGTVYQ